VNTMPRISPRLKFLTLCLSAYAGLVGAQQQTPPSDAPPKLERIEPGSDVPATTVPQRGRTQIIEKKQGGEVKEVEVISGKSHYILRPNRPPGNAVPGSAESGSVGGPMWPVMQFDLGNRKKSEAAAEGAAAAADVPPPPPPARAKK
jgi:hypothetical protein